MTHKPTKNEVLIESQKKQDTLRINQDMLNRPEIKHAMAGFKNLAKKPLQVEVGRKKKGVVHKIKHKINTIKHKVTKAFNR